MGWAEIIIVMVLIAILFAVLLFWQIRLFGYAVIFGLLFVVGVFAMMQSSIGDQIRKEIQDQKAAASQVKRTG